MERTVSVEETARLLNKSLMWVRIGLRQNRIPFGTAVMTKDGKKERWSYCIYKLKLEEYIGKIDD